MSVMVSTVEVEDYEAWRAVYDQYAGARKQHGLSDGHVYQDTANPNRITVVIEGTPEGMKSWGSSDELRDAQSRAGVLSDTTMFARNVS